MGLVGVGGLDGAGGDQLLRSVVIAPGLRSHGFGHTMVQQLVYSLNARSIHYRDAVR
jgi:hypothetical protein